MLTLEEGEFLVRLARNVVTKYITKMEKIHPPKHPSAKLYEKRGAFVTIEKIINERKILRGCIGYPLPHLPLIEAVIESAISAATKDPRFPPLKEKELSEVIFEVSVLTPPKLLEVKNPKDYPKLIKIGRDGLIVEMGYYSGLLLPQVPVEYNWDEETFLSECCMKAGLPPDCWLSRGVRIYSFTAEIFCEERPFGNIVRRELGE
ncbi:MAG: TIGR00296 family protein [Candidatus Methanomethyliaceae archaeon]|nr:TIGR00296 family protein [Candidatus Methanomethyliaceae archaeon]MCX8169576.1 TIGR00296 family protein [Candidatus Methanomethyliaceae archaeon]MDW7970960.1 TIGR00296 family protein [Nitrososphaerota archaeon]